MARRGRRISVPDWVYEPPDTGIKWLWRWCLEIGQINAAAAEIGWKPARLHAFLSDRTRGITGRTAEELSLKVQIPVLALVLKNKPLTELSIEPLSAKAPEEGWE